MSEPQIVLPLGGVRGEYKTERKADSHRRASFIDDVDSNDLRFLAGIESKGGACQISFWRRQDGTVSLVEPFGLRAHLPLCRLAALEAQPEHSYRVGELRGVGQIPVHGVASLRGAQMRKAGPGDDDVGGILMIDRRQNAALFQSPLKIDQSAQPSIGNQPAERNVRLDRLSRQIQRRARALYQAAFAPRRDRQRPLAMIVKELRQPQTWVPSSALAPMRRSMRANIRGSVKLLTAKLAPAWIKAASSSDVVRPTTARPAAAAARIPGSESSKATERDPTEPVSSRALR